MERLTSQQLREEQQKTLASPRMRYGLLARLRRSRQIGYDERVHKLESLARMEAARFR